MEKYRRTLREVVQGTKRVVIDYDTWDRIHNMIREANNADLFIKTARDADVWAEVQRGNLYDRVRGFAEDAQREIEHAGLFFYEVKLLPDNSYRLFKKPEFSGLVTSKNLVRWDEDGPHVTGIAFKIHRKQAVPPRRG